MHTVIRIAALAALLTLPFVAGCGGVLESARPPIHTWLLQPLDEPAREAEATRPGLALEVSVVPGLDTDLVLTLNPDGRLNHYAGARWAENLPELLGSLVRRSLENSGLYEEVHSHGFASPGECSLEIEFRAFWSNVDRSDTTTSVEVKLGGTHACGDVRWPVRHSASAPVSANRMPEIVAAYQRALNDVLRELMEQLDRQEAGK